MTLSKKMQLIVNRMQKILLASLVSAAFAMPAVAAEQADVVIIGSGGAGLSAAVTAHDLGKKSYRS